MTSGVRNYARPGSAPLNSPGTPGSTSGTLGSVTDGTTTVSPVTEIDFTSGATLTDLGSGVAGVAISAGAALTVKEIDGTPSVSATELDVPNGSLTVVGTVATIEYAQKLNGGRETIKSHGSMGATETLDLADGNYHYGTLNANCTLTFAGSTSGEECSFTFEVAEDGTGGWTLTWPGAVLWPGGTEPPHDTTAGSITIYVFLTRDGGTTWFGFEAGAGSLSFATPAIVLGTAAAAGAAATVIRSDSTIAAFDATVPTTQAFGDVAATGSAAKAARRDHLHGMPTPPVTTDHEHIGNVTYSGDGATTAFTLPAAPFDAYSVAAFVAGARTDVTLSGALLDVMTFAVAPAAGTNNIVVDIVAAV